MKTFMIAEGIAVRLSNRTNAKPAENPVFFKVPSRTMLATLFGSILSSRPILSMPYPSTKVVASVIVAAGIKDNGELRNIS